jgi:Putative Ig domain/Abnormal spindle-like microcephaly-assoc'd, ASPM-SPD-2-Hydin
MSVLSVFPKLGGMLPTLTLIGRKLVLVTILGLACGLAVTPCLAQTTDGAIPSSLFGITITYNQDWPTVPFGELGKATEVGWPYIEQTQGVYNWTNLDTWVSIANAHNAPLDWAFQYAPPWAVADQSSCHTLALAAIKGCSADVTNLTAMDAFFTALTQRYNGKNGHGFIAAYELYNQPETFFTGDTVNLVAQTVALSNAVRANSPTSLVIGMGVTYPSTYYAPGNFMDTYWAAGGVKTLDAVAFHGYAHHSSDVPEIVNTFVPYITAAMARNGIPATTPIWDTEGSWGDVTEAGWNITNPAQQAAWVARSYLLHWSDGVSRFDWYGWDAYPWGALWYGTPPPSGLTSGIDAAGVAYGQVYNWMVGATMSEPCSASGTVWTCGLTKSGGTQSLAVWNTSGSSSYTPAGQYTQYRNLAGNTSAITGGSVTIGIEPILLETASTSGPVISVAPGNLAFGSVTINSSGGRSLAISNTGSTSLSITAANVTPSAFSTSGVSVPMTVAAGGSETIPVEFAPSTSGSVTGTISLVSNAPTSPTMIALAGTGVAPLQITTTALPAGQVQSSYTGSLAASGGTAPYSWSLSSGSLPSGLSLSASSGAISGSPTQSGSFSLGVQVKDSSAPAQTTTKALSLSVAAAAASSSGGNAIPATLFGLTVSFYLDWPTVPFGMIAGTGIKWPSIEPTKGVYNWSTLDAYVSVSNAHNVPFEYQTNQAPPWAVSNQASCSTFHGGEGGCSADVTDLASWNAFVTALTQRYNGKNGHGLIAAYELYVEPETFFTGDTANLVAQTAAFYKAVRANSPTSLVVGMGVTYPSTYYAPGNFMDTYWAAGGVKTLDAVCFHGYAHHSSDVPEIVNTYVPYITAALARNGIPATTPIWDTEASWGDVTEAGWNITNPVQQAAWVARSYLLHWSNHVSVFDWYSWDAYPWGALWYSSPPPSGLTSGIDAAGIAYGQVYSWMVGATMSAPCSASGTVWTCGLTKGSTQTLAVWNTSASSSYTPAAQYKHYRNLAGSTTAITGSSVTIGIEPILLEP